MSSASKLAGTGKDLSVCQQESRYLQSPCLMPQPPELCGVRVLKLHGYEIPIFLTSVAGSFMFLCNCFPSVWHCDNYYYLVNTDIYTGDSHMLLSEWQKDY